MEAPLKTAYLLQIHKNPDQVNKFIHQLISEEHADVYVHIDKRSYDDLHEKIVKSPYVKVLNQSITCEWGDISQIATTILLLREVIGSNKKYDFVTLRSGQDLLVKSGLNDFLLKNIGKVFMEIRDIGAKDLVGIEINWPKVTRRRYNTAHPFRIFRRIIYDLYHRGINIFRNKNYWPKDYKFYNGSQWFIIPFEAAKYIIKFIDENEWYYKYFEKTLAPDEWFFHTLLMNSPFQGGVVKNNLLYLKWGEKFTDRGSPVPITCNDIQLIEGSNCFFARKFDEDVDKEVIEYFSNRVKFEKNTEVLQIKV